MTSVTHDWQTPLFTRGPILTGFDSREVTFLRQRCAHFWTLKCWLKNNLCRQVDDDNSVDDGHRGHDRHHHGAEEGEAKMLLAPLRGVLNFWHDSDAPFCPMKFWLISLNRFDKTRWSLFRFVFQNVTSLFQITFILLSFRVY